MHFIDFTPQLFFPNRLIEHEPEHMRTGLLWWCGELVTQFRDGPHAVRMQQIPSAAATGLSIR